MEQGPDLARDGVVRWRCSDLQARLQSDFAVRYHERSVGKLLARLAFRKLTARPFHPEQDRSRPADTQKNFAALIAAALPPHAAGKPLEIWWQDEARVGPAGHADPRVGAPRQQASGPARSSLHLGLHIRRRVPRRAAWVQALSCRRSTLKP